jgi:flagellar FliL protein
MTKDTKDSKNTDDSKGGSSGKKGLIMMIMVAVIAIGGGVGGAWFFLQSQPSAAAGEEAEEIEPRRPSTFMDLDVFTVNLQPDEGEHILQVGLTIKILETDVSDAIKKQMPEIRNRILLLLTSKKSSDISTIVGKEQLSTEITEEIRQSLDSKSMKEEVIGVLFTSFVIQ